MASHDERLSAARDTVEYICSRSPEQMAMPVPNCPGWTVYNAAVHVGRVGVAWKSMIEASPDDPDSRTRGYADAEARGTGQKPAVLGSWALAAIDALVDDVDRACYFSMTGGAGTVGLWGWHVASELGVHRLDVEDAVGEPHEISDLMAVDALDYTTRFFLPAMARATETDPGVVAVAPTRGGAEFPTQRVQTADSDTTPAVTVAGTPVDLLLALWGRPHGPIDIAGSHEVLDHWKTLPGLAFQFGTWD